jgi:CTP synthase (UTP-ammonia lyase)
MRVALLIDSPPTAPYHVATVAALHHAAEQLGWRLDLRVHATDDLPSSGDLGGAGGVVIGPGSPYRDEQAVWSVVGAARERGVPLVGT